MLTGQDVPGDADQLAGARAAGGGRHGLHQPAAGPGAKQPVPTLGTVVYRCDHAGLTGTVALQYQPGRGTSFAVASGAQHEEPGTPGVGRGGRRRAARHVDSGA